MTKKNIFIETYGCQMNVYDTELIKSILTQKSHTITDTEEAADIVMLNTCSVRENANNKIYNRVHEIKHKDPNKLIGVLGCMATNFKTELLDNQRLKIDFIAGPDNYKQLPQLIEEVSLTGNKKFDVTLSEFETYSDITPTRKDGVNAWIAIMRGCNNFCTFCVVPYTRGRERSRDPHNIVEEVKKLVTEGFTQVTLLGQNVNSYKSGNYDFTDLMKMVSDVEGIKRIRYTSPHPKDFPRKLLTLMSEKSNICNQLHMPLQAGNNRILEKMNRNYTKETFIKLVNDVREIIPNASISTDIIIGFPTESYEEFLDTVDIVKQLQFDAAFIFKYSERPNTRAAIKFPDDVSEQEKTKRIIELNDIQKAIIFKKNLQQIGQTQTILIESLTTKKSDDFFQARNEANQIVIIPKSNDYTVGDYITVSIYNAGPNTLFGKNV